MRHYTPKHRLNDRHYHPLKIILLLVAFVLVFTVGYELFIWHTSANQIVTDNNNHLPEKLKKRQPFNVLVMGTDVGALGRGTSYAGNTDTMELITVNPEQRRILMTAIPRDTLVEINSDKGTKYAKINAAYAIGGPRQAKKQVSELLNVPVDFYAVANMGTLEKVVNAVGGVDVNNPFAFTYENHHFKKGFQHLNGSEALKYSRMRYDDPNNDYGRQKRGQQVIASVISSFKDHGSIVAANKIILATKDGVRTDLPLDNVGALYFKYHQAMANTQHTHLQEKDAVIDGVDFQVASPRELNNTSQHIHSVMGSKATPIHNHETALYRSQTSWDGYRNLDFQLPNHAEYNQFN